MGGGDALFTCQVGDGARELQDPVIGASGESHLAHGRAEQRLSGIVQRCVLAQLLRSHVSIRQQTAAGEARCLDLARPLHALPDGSGELARTAIGKLLVGNAGDFEVDVDAVQQGSADPLLVATNGARGARAGTPRVAMVAAGTSMQVAIKVRSSIGLTS